MKEEDRIQKMEYLKKYQAQNNNLAKTINKLKCELRKSKDEIISLYRQLQVEREKSIVLETEQSELFDCLENVDAILDETFQQSVQGYSQISSIIAKIQSKNPKNQTDDFNCAFDLNCTFDATNRSQIDEVSITSETNKVADMHNEHLEPDTLKEDLRKDLNSTVLFDSDYVSDESMCQEVGETIKLPESTAKSDSVDNLNESHSSRGRRVKRIDYREASISRKLRRIQ